MQILIKQKKKKIKWNKKIIKVKIKNHLSWDAVAGVGLIFGWFDKPFFDVALLRDVVISRFWHFRGSINRFLFLFELFWSSPTIVAVFYDSGFS